VLKLLLDEHISPAVAKGLRRRDGSLIAIAMTEWENGDFLGQDDAVCLRNAARQGLTLVTYDLRTIPPLLKSWIEEGRRHSGVIFVDEKTSSPADIGGLIRALRLLIKETRHSNWTDSIRFLRT
jgi:hypothetical protein